MRQSMITVATVLGLMLGFFNKGSAKEFFPPILVAENERFVRNGSGKRTLLLVDLYSCALYLKSRTADRARIMDPRTPVLVRIQIHGSPPSRIPSEWRQAIRAELSDRMFGRAKRAYRDFEDGDRIQLVYIPGRGTSAFLNGTLFLEDRSHGLMHSLLLQWLGPEPVSETLREALTAPQTGRGLHSPNRHAMKQDASARRTAGRDVRNSPSATEDIAIFRSMSNSVGSISWLS